MLITFAKFEQISKMLAIFDYKLFVDLLSPSDFCNMFWRNRIHLCSSNTKRLLFIDL